MLTIVLNYWQQFGSFTPNIWCRVVCIICNIKIFKKIKYIAYKNIEQQNVFSLDLPGNNFFSNKCYFRFSFYFICEKRLYRLPKGFVICDVTRINIALITKKFFFSLLIKLTQRLRCLLYAFVSMSLFMFQNLFLRRDLLMISLFNFLFVKGAWFALTYSFFMGACLWIASSRAALNRTNSKSLFSEVIWVTLFKAFNTNTLI